MKKAVKITIAVLIAIAILIGIVLYYGLSNLDGLVANAIEHYGSQATGTSVSVGDVDISLTDGTAEIHHVVIANPPGYDTPYALKMKTLTVKLDLDSISTQKIVMDEIAVGGASLYAEFQGTESNLSVILDNLQQAGGPPPEQQPQSGIQMKFVVDHFQFYDGKVALKIERANVDRIIQLPDISVHDIGVSTGGVSAAGLARQLLRPVFERVVDQVEAKLKARARAFIEKKKAELKDKAKEKLKQQLKELDLSGG